MQFLYVLLEVVVKVLIASVTGAGVGLLIFGIGMVADGAPDFNRYGPPPGPAFIGLGSGLLIGAASLMGLFFGPLSRRRWFIVSDSEAPPIKKWKQVG